MTPWLPVFPAAFPAALAAALLCCFGLLEPVAAEGGAGGKGIGYSGNNSFGDGAVLLTTDDGALHLNASDPATQPVLLNGVDVAGVIAVQRSIGRE